ncbi:MAG: DUF6705 family protein [Daejeonella sp.]
MKRTIILLILVLGGYSVQSQIISFKKGDYIKNNSIDKFIGQWKYTHGNETLIFSFKKNKQYYPTIEIYKDIIKGNYLYMKDGKILAKISDATIVIGDTNLKGNQNILEILFTDIGSDLHKKMDIKWLSNNQLEFKMGIRENIRVNKKQKTIVFKFPEKGLLERYEGK